MPERDGGTGAVRGGDVRADGPSEVFGAVLGSASRAYVMTVRGSLASTMPTAERDEALRELASLLAEDAARIGEDAAIAALGTPEAYAAGVTDAASPAPAGDDEPQGRVLGMPYDFRGASADRIASRVWNPADPRIFTPRLFGVGWTINFGALAVRLGLLKPDDTGDETFERIPERVVRIALAVPALLALAAVVIAAVAWPSLPAEVPVHWGPSGRPDDFAPKAWGLGLLLAITVLPVVVTYARILRRGTPARTRVLSAAVLGVLSMLGAGILLLTVLDARGGSHGTLVLPLILAALALSFALLYLPLRAGMRAEWHHDLSVPREDEC